MSNLGRKTIPFGLLYLVIFILAAGFSYTALSFAKIFVKSKNISFVSNKTPTPSIIPSITIPKGSSFSALLLGYGGKDHDGGYLTDSIILIRVDPKQKKAVLITIPRDLWVQIPRDGNNTTANKINAAYAMGLNKGDAGAGTLAKYVAGYITGINADYFVSVDFENFKNIIDTLGGISVNVVQNFDDNFFPIKGKENDTCGKSAAEIETLKQKYRDFELEKQFACRYEHLHFDKGETVMNGDTALKFVRSRHSDTYGGDFSRSQRQLAVLQAVETKLISLNALSKGSKIINQLSSMVRTDLGLSQINTIIDLLGNPNDYKINEIQLTDSNVLTDSVGPGGQFILIPKDGVDNWSGVQKFISDKIN